MSGRVPVHRIGPKMDYVCKGSHACSEILLPLMKLSKCFEKQPFQVHGSSKQNSDVLFSGIKHVFFLKLGEDR